MNKENQNQIMQILLKLEAIYKELQKNLSFQKHKIKYKKLPKI